MQYRVSFKIVIGKKDATIHVIQATRENTVCGIPKQETVGFIHVALMAWCPKCHDAYLRRDEKDFALIND